jgi:hypothetical protein
VAMSEEPPAAPPPRPGAQPPQDGTPPPATQPLPATPPPAQPDPAGDQPAAQPASEPAATAAEPPPSTAATPSDRRARVRGFVGHRATQLVAVGLLGLILGGGIVALADRDDHRGGPGRGDDRGHHKFYDRGPGPGPDFDRPRR